MQQRSRFLCSRLRGSQLLALGQLQVARLCTLSTTATLGGDELHASAGIPELAESTAKLHSVISVREGPNAFASATVTFGDSQSYTPGGCASAARSAAQVALLAVRGALGVQRPPSALLALTSVELPGAAVQQVAAALAEQVGPDTALIGCSSRFRIPDERREAATSAEWQANSPARPGGRQGHGEGHAAAPLVPPAAPPLHITLAAAHLPDHEVHAVRSETSSLPRLPYLAESLQGVRPPVFLLLAGSDSLSSELLSRLENLLPGSCIGSGVAATRRAFRDRRTGTLGALGEPGGGGGRAAFAEDAGTEAAGADAGAGVGLRGSGAPASDLEGPFQRMLLDREGSGLSATISSGVGDATIANGDDGRGPTPSTSGSSPSASSLSASASSSAYSRTGDSGTSSNTSSGGTGRRRRPPPAAASAWASPNPASDNPEPGGTVASSLLSRTPAPADSSNFTKDHWATEAPAASTSTATLGGGGGVPSSQAPPAVDSSASSMAAAEAVTGLPESSPLASLTGPLLMVGDQVYSGGVALLAVYPRAAAAGEDGRPAAGRGPAAAAAAGEGGGRLGAAVCDRLARMALGTDHLHYVALRGAALSAISPPPTGPEPADAYPPAPDNPYYWWPATTTMPRLQVNPHLDLINLNQGPDMDLNLDPARASGIPHGAAGQGGEGRGARDEAALAGGERAAGCQGGKEKEEEEEEDNESDSDGEADGGSPSAAVLEALREGLAGLPLFPLGGTLLFPGQTIQLRIFEKRYRLLARSCLEQGAAFGLCWQGMGSTAVVRGYQRPDNDSADIMVILEGGMRFSYREQDLALLPASYGLNVAKRAEYVVDDPPADEAESGAMMAAAHAIMDGIAGAMEAAATPAAQHAARTFANALHFASSQAQPQPSPPSQPQATEASSADAASPASSPAGATSTSTAAAASGAAAGAVAGPQAGDSEAAGGDSGDSDAALLAADVAEAKRALDPDTASLLSLYLAPHIPVQHESLRRQWFTTRNALWRLQQEAAWLRSNQRVCLAVASSVLRLPREHPLRIMLGLSRVAPIV